MEIYRRHKFEYERCTPNPFVFAPETNFWRSFRNYLCAMLVWPWWYYLLFALLMVVPAVMVGWQYVLMGIGILVLFFVLAGLYTAKTYRDMAEGVGIVIDKEGISYSVVIPTEDDEDEAEDDKVCVQNVSTSTWQELNEVRVFKDFVVFKFVPTSKLRIVFMRLPDDEDKAYHINNILAFWDAAADDVPRGMDRRLLYLLIFVGILVLKFLRRKYM